MARQIINTGTTANDGTGDSLRISFTKVNQNFAEVYTSIGSAFSGNYNDLTNKPTLFSGNYNDLTGKPTLFSGNYNDLTNKPTNISSFANDSGYITASISTNLLPSVDSAYDLGSPTNQWGSLYVSANTIFVGGTPISVDVNGNLLVNDNLVSGSTDTGDITFSSSTISAPDDTSITIQALDFNSVLRSRIRLTPDVGAVSMRGFSSDNDTTFDTGDWSSASWVASGSTGALVIVGAATINDFIQNDLNYANNIRFSINGGEPESLESYGYTSGSQTLTINTAVPPETDPTVVTEVEFFYTFSSSVSVDYDDGNVLLSARGDMNIRLESDEDINLIAGDDIRIEGEDSFRLINNSTTAPIRIITDDNNNSYTWQFRADGTLTFPDQTSQSTAYPGPQTSLEGNVTGSVFGSANTLLVDGTNDKIVGPVETASTITVTVDGNGTLTSSSGYAQLSGDNGAELYFDNGALITSYVGVGEDSIELVVTDMTPGSSSQSSLAMSSAGNTALASTASINLVTNNGPSPKTFRFDGDGDLTIPGVLMLPPSGVITTLNHQLTIGTQEFDIRTDIDTVGTGYDLTIGPGGTGNLATAAADLILRGGGTSSTGVDGGDLYLNAGGGGIGGTNGDVILGNEETASVQIRSILKIDDGVQEKFQTLADATGTVTHDCSSGQIFYHTSPDANWTVNLTNLNIASTYATSVTLIIIQGDPAYYPNALQIAGSAQTINWQGGSAPTPTTSGIDVVTFSIINNSGTYTVLGQLTDFNTVS